MSDWLTIYETESGVVLSSALHQYFDTGRPFTNSPGTSNSSCDRVIPLNDAVTILYDDNNTTRVYRSPNDYYAVFNPETQPWSACTTKELDGDFNGLNGFSLGDALFLANMWAGIEPLTPCMYGDLNQINAFSLGDALFLANVWAGIESFPWGSYQQGMQVNQCHTERRRRLQATQATSTYYGYITYSNASSDGLTIDIFAVMGTTPYVTYDDTQPPYWNALQVVFDRPFLSVSAQQPDIVSVESANKDYVGFLAVPSVDFVQGHVARLTFAEVPSIDYADSKTRIELEDGDAIIYTPDTAIVMQGPTGFKDFLFFGPIDSNFVNVLFI